MRRLTNGDPERGAVAVLVGILLVLLVTFVGVGVDLASAYAKTQEIQNAADAAALAIAQECADDAGAGSKCLDEQGGGGPLAKEMTEGNVRLQKDTLSKQVTIDVAAGSVNVMVGGEHQNFFLGPVFSSFTVREDATAIWGVPVAGHASLPIAISQCSFEHRVDGADIPIDGNITIWMDHPSDPFGDDCNEAYPDGGFGWLITEGGKCEADIEVAPDGESGVGKSYTGVKQPPDCISDDAFKRAVLSDEPVLIPIFDVAPDGGHAAPVSIIQFAAFDLQGYEIHNKVGTYPSPSKCDQGPKEDTPELKSCLYGEFVGYKSFKEGMELIAPSPSDETLIIKLTD